MAAIVEALTPARELKTGQVVVSAGELVVVEAVHRHITRDDLVHVIVRTRRGGVLIIERDPGFLFDTVEARR